MADVNPPRLPLRQRQALTTRREIVAAARRLFSESGYATTSIEVVAREAGVAPRTVYAAFGTKKAILAAICDEWLAEAGVREAVAEGLRLQDLAGRLVLAAHAARRQWESERGVVAMLEGAAASDAAVAAMLAGWRDDRAGSFRLLFDGLESQLRPGLEVARAAAILRALTNAGAYMELVSGDGWTPDAYEEWLRGTLATLLLPPAPAG